MFRAVITAVMETDVEVHYIDYGNYENVTRSELRNINDQVTFLLLFGHPVLDLFAY